MKEKGEKLQGLFSKLENSSIDKNAMNASIMRILGGEVSKVFEEQYP